MPRTHMLLQRYKTRMLLYGHRLEKCGRCADGPHVCGPAAPSAVAQNALNCVQRELRLPPQVERVCTKPRPLTHAVEMNGCINEARFAGYMRYSNKPLTKNRNRGPGYICRSERGADLSLFSFTGSINLYISGGEDGGLYERTGI